MRTDLEELDDLLPALRDSARGDPQAPTEVYRRLKFLARVMAGAKARADGEKKRRAGAEVLWLNERGDVCSLPVTDEGIVIGRDPACDVVLAGPRVSRRHCTVRVQTSAVGGALAAEIEDLGSVNGTCVNGVKLGAGSRSLQDGDVIEAGGVALAVVASQRTR